MTGKKWKMGVYATGWLPRLGFMGCLYFGEVSNKSLVCLVPSFAVNGLGFDQLTSSPMVEQILEGRVTLTIP